MRILVADDSKTNLELITSSLQKLGHEVMAASYGQQAIEMFQVKRPDLIILDVVMEGMDGFECAKRIRAIHMEDWIPIIFLSGSVDDESIVKGIDAGGDDYLAKPFSEITLAAKIKAMQRISVMRENLYEATKKLSILSSTDALTGAYNRLQFNKSIKEKIHQASRQKNLLALLFLDLDKFKAVNDTFGHRTGDLLLIEVTRRLQACLRLDDFLARMGGDEFAIILTDIEHKDVVHCVLQKIIDTLSSPYHLDGNTIHCSSSIGVVFYPDDGVDQEELARKADLAMYHAKKKGRNNFQYYNENISSEENEKLKVENNTSSLSPLDHKFLVLNCLVNNSQICINLEYVQKNLSLPQLNLLPNSPSYLVGLMNLAGKSISVIDLGARLNLQRTQPYSLNTPVLLCADQGREVGFIVDQIIGIYELDHQDIHTQDPNNTTSLFLAPVTIGNELSLLVNMHTILSIDYFSGVESNG